MVLDNYRSSLDWWLVPLAKSLRRIEPDVFTWTSLVAAAVGGWAFWASSPERPGLLLLAWGMVLANSVLDLLDGKIAAITGKASPRGDFLDHSIDRFSDVLLLGGIALSPWARTEIGLVAVVGTLLTSYMGTQAQAIGIGRNYGGLLGRADRMVLMLSVPLVEYLWTGPLRMVNYPPASVPGGSTWLELMLGYIALMGVLTTAQRFLGGLGAFDASGKIKGKG